MLTCKIPDLGREKAVRIYRIGRQALVADDACIKCHLVVFFAKSWSLMHNTHTVIRCDVCSVQDSEAMFLELFVEVVEQRLISPSFHFGAF